VAKSSLKLALFDIDGTLRRARDPWIHLHHHLGVAEQAKDLPTRWQRGEITYEQWAQLDASLWRGSTRETIVAALGTNPFRDGARELIDWFTSRAIPCVGISSGLSIFNEITAAELGIKEIISNELQFDGDICNGEISIQVNEENKGEVMDETLERYSVSNKQVAAFGDGTADIPLLKQAGLGVAICPTNEVVWSAADHVVAEEPIHTALPFVDKHFRVV
jgi:phosphoserine phosphatase